MDDIKRLMELAGIPQIEDEGPEYGCEGGKDALDRIEDRVYSREKTPMDRIDDRLNPEMPDEAELIADDEDAADEQEEDGDGSTPLERIEARVDARRDPMERIQNRVDDGEEIINDDEEALDEEDEETEEERTISQKREHDRRRAERKGEDCLCGQVPCECGSDYLEDDVDEPGAGWVENIMKGKDDDELRNIIADAKAAAEMSRQSGREAEYQKYKSQWDAAHGELADRSFQTEDDDFGQSFADFHNDRVNGAAGEEGPIDMTGEPEMDMEPEMGMAEPVDAHDMVSDEGEGDIIVNINIDGEALDGPIAGIDEDLERIKKLSGLDEARRGRKPRDDWEKPSNNFKGDQSYVKVQLDSGNAIVVCNTDRERGDVMLTKDGSIKREMNPEDAQKAMAAGAPSMDYSQWQQHHAEAGMTDSEPENSHDDIFDDIERLKKMSGI